ncbi:SWIM zinc finger family protein [Pseudanabaena sp. PCC 6802]|uniref:SWIM zinc finger family protein n=1 Tax=Pseudanabaena sp. PCC 6802 TaxID=118173 RepID=UPI0003487B8D|nr:SWIM zinc finger family protein [Pseudanabaena sp. PCC 6802]
MAKFSRTWWGQKFITALESFTDSGRLQRGRSYAGPSRILKFDIDNGKVTATIRGNVNPYFGVYKEPKYHTQIELNPIASKDWSQIIQRMSSKASIVAKLLLNEVPDNIEESFREVGKQLLPYSRKDFQTECSCPDYSNPCKHIAGLCYRLSTELDRDPFLLFELRGLSKTELQAELAKSPLGRVLSAELTKQSALPEPAASYYTQPKTAPMTSTPSMKEFWQGRKRLPQNLEIPSHSGVSAIAIKKQGDFPAFWHRDNSFIEAMEELYVRVKTKNKGVI